MLAINRRNRFSVFRDESENEYEFQKYNPKPLPDDLIKIILSYAFSSYPVSRRRPFSDEILNLIYSYIGATPTAKLVTERFSTWYDGKLTVYEIENLKLRMFNCKEELDTAGNKLENKIWNCLDTIRNLRKECDSNPKCLEDLRSHVSRCGNGCTRTFVSYQCKFKDYNGRCSHYYQIEQKVEEKDYYDEILDSMKERFNEAEYEYTRQLAKKENRLAEYQAEIDSDYENYENWAFHESMRISDILRRVPDVDDW
jgi:hypothetical protein